VSKCHKWPCHERDLTRTFVGGQFSKTHELLANEHVGFFALLNSATGHYLVTACREMSSSAATGEKREVKASGLLLHMLCCAGAQPRLLLAICIHLAFVCLFVCLMEQTPENHTPPPVRREVNPLGVITHGHRHIPRAYQWQRHNLWLTLYKLTGCLASLDLRQPYTKRILSHRKAPPNAIFDVLGLDGGRG